MVPPPFLILEEPFGHVESGILFSWTPKSLQMVTAATKLKLFFLKKRSYDKPRQHIKKQRHLFANKGPYSQSYVFSNSHVQMWELDHKEAYHQIIDAFKLWSKRILRVPWTSGRWKQSILKEINSKYSLEGLMLKLKIQYYGHLIRRPNSSEKIPMLGNTEDQRTRGTQRMRW